MLCNDAVVQSDIQNFTKNLSAVDKIVFELINNKLNVSDISLLIIEYYQCFTWNVKDKPRNCEISNNGHTMRVSKGTTGQWEHVIANQGGKYLEFSIHLDNINNNSNNVCIGIISKPVISNTSGGGYNGNGTVIAFGSEYFRGNNMATMGRGYIMLPTRNKGRWKKGDRINITADTNTSIITYEWGSGHTKRTESHNFVQNSNVIYPVVCIWYKDDTVTFVS